MADSEAVETLVGKNIGTIVSAIMFFFTAISVFVRHLTNRVSAVEMVALTNALEIKHIRSDLVELKDTAKSNHIETIRLIEGVRVRLDGWAARRNRDMGD